VLEKDRFYIRTESIYNPFCSRRALHDNRPVKNTRLYRNGKSFKRDYLLKSPKSIQMSHTDYNE